MAEALTIRQRLEIWFCNDYKPSSWIQRHLNLSFQASIGASNAPSRSLHDVINPEGCLKTSTSTGSSKREFPEQPRDGACASPAPSHQFPSPNSRLQKIKQRLIWPNREHRWNELSLKRFFWEKSRYNASVAGQLGFEVTPDPRERWYI